ncbi:MAG: ribosomal-protein-alanine N-acetyltransferase [Desulfurococcales archaeon ex4484_58]|nr:MAG: ribosomal-protein-alanine N-acetyltransferase [Desulfurococcales archaeon ex4484_58]
MILGKKSDKQRSTSIYEIYDKALERLEKKATGYTIRNARREDLGKVQEINRASLPENYPFYFFEELWSHYGRAFYVAESPSKEVVGYVMCRVERKPGFFRHFLVKSGHIVSIAVLEAHRGRGLGYGLMAYALKSLYEEYGCEETYLEVRVSNKPAINLYEKLGYVKVKIEHHYYLDGEDAYVMARVLP